MLSVFRVGASHFQAFKCKSYPNISVILAENKCCVDPALGPHRAATTGVREGKEPVQFRCNFAGWPAPPAEEKKVIKKKATDLARPPSARSSEHLAYKALHNTKSAYTCAYMSTIV